jgi:hypothetical protein
VRWFSTGILLVDPSLQPNHVQERLLQAQSHLLPFCGRHHCRSFTPLSLRTPGQLSHEVDVLQQRIRGADFHGVRFLELTLSAEKELRTRKDALPHIPRSVSPCLVQITDLATREVVLRDCLGQHLTVLAFRAGQRHQVLHRRLGRDAPGADVFLDGLR